MIKYKSTTRKHLTYTDQETDIDIVVKHNLNFFWFLLLIVIANILRFTKHSYDGTGIEIAFNK